MKHSIKSVLVSAFTMLSFQSFSQNAEPVYRITREIHSSDWYSQQAKAWKQEIDKKSNDKMAWVYWFTANRYASYTNEKAKENNDYLRNPEDILKLAEKTIPNTFEYYFMKTYNSGDERFVEYIQKAQALRPYDSLLLPVLMNYYQFTNDKANVNIVSQKWLESKEIPFGMLAAAYNMLNSVEPNGILLTGGDNDTYPLWVLQNAKKIRTDVLVLNSSLLQIDNYRKWIFSENKLSDPKIFNNQKEVVTYFLENVKSRPVYVSAFMDNGLYKEYGDKMYLTGLAFKYSEKPFDNLGVLQNNAENKFMIDHLQQSFLANDAQSAVSQMNLGYLPMFIKLYEHYKLCGETLKAQKLKDLARTVGNNGGDTECIKYFEK